MEEIWDRTRQARENLGIDAKEMPEKFKQLDIEITSDAYYKYEKRSPLKQHLIAPFCEITGIRVEWLLTGEGEMLSNQSFEQPEAKVMHLFDELITSVKNPFVSDMLKSLQKQEKETKE